MSHAQRWSLELTILVLAIFLGFEVISKVPTLLHTPLMSGTNAIHGIVIVGAMLVAGLGAQGHADAHRSASSPSCSPRRTSSAASSSPTACSRCSRSASRATKEYGRVSTNASNLLYLVTIVTFILALRFLSTPATRAARQLDRRGGMLARDRRRRSRKPGVTSTGRSRRRWRSAAPSAPSRARRVKMTAMPQMVALFNGVGGGAAALVSLAEFHRSRPPRAARTPTSRSRSSSRR